MNIWGNRIARYFGSKVFQRAMIGSEMSKSYEEAVVTLNTLQSNASVLEKVRKERGKMQGHNLPDVIKFAQRADITLDDIDKLSVIHVSGTKGKGSTCAFCENILRSHGYKTGFYSSPHLIEVRERIRINGRPLSKEAFSTYFWDVYQKLEASKDEHGGTMPSYFRFLTIMALHVFRKEQVDVAILEVGIGGEYDCTNIVRRPVVCGVSSLGLDHTTILGDTVQKIAWHKAGIFKAGVPALTVSNQPGNSMDVLAERAVEKGCSLRVVPLLRNYDWGQHMMELGIHGDLQHLNASLALQLANTWMKHKTNDKCLIDDFASRDDVKEVKDEVAAAEPFLITPTYAAALKGCWWPGRNQMIQREEVTYYIDGAHTPESIKQCVHWFQSVSIKESQGIKGKVVKLLLFNSTGDRESSSLLQYLVPIQFDCAVFCPNIGTLSVTCADRTNLMVTKDSQLSRTVKNRNVWLELLEHHLSANISANHNPDASISANGDHLPVKQIKLDSDSIIAHTANDSQSNCLVHNDSQSELSLQGDSMLNDKLSTMTFPCILDSLEWVGQGRDRHIWEEEVDYLRTHLIHNHLKDAAHIQVLVTGSIHLVGGVLGFLDPGLNDRD